MKPVDGLYNLSVIKKVEYRHPTLGTFFNYFLKKFYELRILLC